MKAELTFEQALKRPEEIVNQMEQGRATLDDSLKLFEEGTRLAAICGMQLDEAELKVTRLMKGPDGNPVEVAFDHGNDF